MDQNAESLKDEFYMNQVCQPVLDQIATWCVQVRFLCKS